MIIVGFIFFIASVSFTFFVRKLALKKNIIDTPNERSSHSIPTPRGGGLAIVITWFCGISYMYILGCIERELLFALLSGLALAVVSLLDDILDLKPTIRILAQALSSFGALYFLGGLHVGLSFMQTTIGDWIWNIVVFIGMLWFINLYNFLDGIDAYASQEAILVALGILIITGNPILVLLIAIVLGFLVWNWPKAKIFMGDVGSTQLGFILVVLGIYFHNTQELNIINWLLLTSIFWFDATFTLLRRLKNKEKLSVAHKKHAYQRLIQGGFSHLRVNFFAIALNTFLIGLVLVNHYILNTDTLILGVVIVMLLIINSLIDSVFPFKK